MDSPAHASKIGSRMVDFLQNRPEVDENVAAQAHGRKIQSGRGLNIFVKRRSIMPSMKPPLQLQPTRELSVRQRIQQIQHANWERNFLNAIDDAVGDVAAL